MANSKLKGFFKLKEDQIRIIFRPLTNDTYYFLGVLVKKDTDANREYIRIISRNRNIDVSNMEDYELLVTEGEDIYNNVISYLETNSRKGNR